MNVVYKRKDFAEIDGKARVEARPILKKAKASTNTMRRVEHYKVGKADALGNVIEQGKEFYYHDWDDRANYEYAIYLLRTYEVQGALRGEPGSTVDRWDIVEAMTGPMDRAIQRAKELLNGEK